MVKVKAGKVRNLTDARYFSAQGVDWLGFDLDQMAEGALTLMQFQEIIGWVEGPGMVAEFGFIEPDILQPILTEIEIDCLQLNQFSASPEHFKGSIIREVVVEEEDNLAMLELKIDLTMKSEEEVLLLNFYDNRLTYSSLGSRVPLKPEGLKQLSEGRDYILAMDFEEDSLRRILNEVRPMAIELRGSDETQTGWKSYEDLDPLFELLRD